MLRISSKCRRCGNRSSPEWERSLENVLIRLHESGYDVGAVSSTSKKRLGNGNLDGADIVAALKLLSREDIIAGGLQKAQNVLKEAGFHEAKVIGKVVSHRELKTWLGK